MRFEKAFIPYGAYWSTPFTKWQGSLSTINAVQLAAQAANHALAARDREDRLPGDRCSRGAAT